MSGVFARAVQADIVELANGLAELRRELIRRDALTPYEATLDDLLALADDIVSRMELDIIFGPLEDAEDVP
jgi:hypothetical protein